MANKIVGSIDSIPPGSNLESVIRRVNETNAQLWGKALKLEEEVDTLKTKNAELEILIRKVQSQ